MSALRNPRHEQFAQLVATGRTPAEAYVDLGYSEKKAHTCGPRLLTTIAIAARVSELQKPVTAAPGTTVDRAFVIRELMDNALKAKNDRDWSASNRALELVGRTLAMFNPLPIEWDGNLQTLSDEQLANFAQCIAVREFGHDPDRLAIEKRRIVAEMRGRERRE